jgi:hypothetical protein
MKMSSPFFLISKSINLRSIFWFNFYAVHSVNSVVCPVMRNTNFFNQPSCSHLQTRRPMGWIKVAQMKGFLLVCQSRNRHTIFLPFLQVFHWPSQSFFFVSIWYIVIEGRILLCQKLISMLLDFR